MTTRRIAIAGTDGTGKTTLVRRLAERFEDRPGTLLAFRAPQYHEGPDHPFGLLSASIDALSELGDRLNEPRLKATALFLSMTLYGDVERHLASTYVPKFLVAERQCLADSLTYARFYLPLVTGPLDQGKLEGPVRETLDKLSPKAWDRLNAWLPVFQARADLAAQDFWNLPLYMRALFERPPEELLGSLQALYHATPPDHVVLLTVRLDALLGRLAEKRGQVGAAPQEIHEQANLLGMFQGGLAQSCEALRLIAPGMTITTLDSSDRTIDDTVSEVLSVIGVEA